MNIVNLTPHEVVILNEDKEVVKRVPKSGTVARLESERRLYRVAEGIPFWMTNYGKPVMATEAVDYPFPEPEDGTIYIVSLLFRTSMPRHDLWSPGELVRDENGGVIGCIGLSQ